MNEFCFCIFSRSSTIRFNYVLAIDHVYGGINLIKYFLFWLQVLEPIVYYIIKNLI